MAPDEFLRKIKPPILDQIGIAEQLRNAVPDLSRLQGSHLSNLFGNLGWMNAIIAADRDRLGVNQMEGLISFSTHIGKLYAQDSLKGFDPARLFEGFTGLSFELNKLSQTIDHNRINPIAGLSTGISALAKHWAIHKPDALADAIDELIPILEKVNTDAESMDSGLQQEAAEQVEHLVDSLVAFIGQAYQGYKEQTPFGKLSFHLALIGVLLAIWSLIPSTGDNRILQKLNGIDDKVRKLISVSDGSNQVKEFKVHQRIANSRVNLRNNKNTKATIITVIPKEAEILVMAKFKKWVYIQYCDESGNLFVGYAMSKYFDKL